VNGISAIDGKRQLSSTSAIDGKRQVGSI